MSCPLTLFRKHLKEGTPMKEMNVNGDKYYAFGDTAFPADCLTALQMLGQEEFYTLEDVVFCWSMIDKEHNFYVREATGRKLKAVTLIQKRKLNTYLTSDINSALGLVPNAPYAASVPVSDLLSKVDVSDEPEAKRLRLDESEQNTTYETTVNYDTSMEIDSQPSQDEGIRALNADLDADKITQLRNRVKKNLKKAPVNLAEDVYDDPIAEFPFDEASEDEVGLALKELETPGCSRVQLYNCEGLDLESVMEYITEEVTKKNRPNPNNSFVKPQMPMNGASQKKPTTGYSRYDQEVFRPELDTDLDIDMDLSFRGNTKKALMKQPLLSQPPKPPQRLDFGPANALNPNGRPPKRQSKTPIIIIPASGTALITMYNAEDIIQEMKFVSSEERKKQKTRRENEVLIHRRKENGTTVPFRIIEDPKKLRDEEWDRVVAVFVQGPAWQFKGWRFGSVDKSFTPTEIFARICAFHLKFDEQPLDKNVAQWSVNVLSLSQTKRHLDRAVLNKFWTTLDRYLVKNKPHLRF
ncbi:unnamed protein product [Bursaphelenchus okinawaensis]|uniref:Parafibromin n=1 Tax=Bursaphelenchus okinawaensis TaxID=465554 RepID=A0A811LAN9_9BILA|nr:unnamed protein product [Bursaphelenchus okinawaensis]CAG9119728.1 unnamed protein product [Bursaphelenchus okinawaensis]